MLTRQMGFTLIEIMLTIIILGIIIIPLSSMFINGFKQVYRAGYLYKKVSEVESILLKAKNNDYNGSEVEISSPSDDVITFNDGEETIEINIDRQEIKATINYNNRELSLAAYENKEGEE